MFFSMDPRKLFEAYDKNPVAANLKYAGERIKLKGRVSGINGDGDYCSVEIASAYYGWEGRYIICYTSDVRAVARLKIGKDVSVEGTVTSGGTPPTLEDCTITL